MEQKGEVLKENVCNYDYHKLQKCNFWSGTDMLAHANAPCGQNHERAGREESILVCMPVHQQGNLCDWLSWQDYLLIL